MDLFTSNAGTVTRVMLNDTAMPGSVELIQSSSTNQNKAATTASLFIITGIDYSQSTNHQFQNSLDNNIYLYIFGDKISNVVVSGFAFTSDCDGKNNGITDILDFYNKNKVSNLGSKGTVPIIKIKFGTSEFIYCYLIDSRLIMTDPTTRLAQFALTLRAIPPGNN